MKGRHCGTELWPFAFVPLIKGALTDSTAESICNVIVRSPRLCRNSEETPGRPYNQPDPRAESANLEHVHHPDCPHRCVCKTSGRSGSSRSRTAQGNDTLLQDYVQLTCCDDNLLAVFCVHAGHLGLLRALLVIVAFEAVWPAVT